MAPGSSPTALTVVLRRAALTLAALAAAGACGGSDVEPSAELAAAHMRTLYADRVATLDDSIDAFIDYSAGMGQGMQAASDVLDRLKSFLQGRAVAYYSVGASAAPTPIDINSPSANFVNLANFTERGSRLGGPLDRIRFNPNRTAVFITDFERVDDVNLKQVLAGAPGPHPIDASAWGQNAIREWLRSGNRLDIFARRFNKPDVWFDRSGRISVQNSLYILVFTPWADASDPDRLKASTLGYLLEQFEGAPADANQHFSVWADGIRLERVNDGASGNANPNIAPDVFAIDSSTRVPHEYYEWALNELNEFREDASYSDKRILNGVKVTAAIPILDTAVLGISVRDVTASMRNLGEVAAAPPVRTDTNPETGKIDTLEAPTPLDPSLIGGELAADVFEFVYNDETHEVGIKIDADFSGVAAVTTYRVAVVLKETQAMAFEDPAGALSLHYGGGYVIHPLRESVQFAVRDVAGELKGKEVYVFYITLRP